MKFHYLIILKHHIQPLKFRFIPAHYKRLNSSIDIPLIDRVRPAQKLHRNKGNTAHTQHTQHDKHDHQLLKRFELLPTRFGKVN